MKKIYFLALLIFLFVFINGIKLEDIYDKKPDIAKSFEGALKESEKIKVLKYLNNIRALHGLKPVTYNSKADIFTAKASLIMAANNTFTHTPPADFKNWSNEGAIGAKQSNLGFFNYTDISMIPASETFIDLWLIDKNVESLGHRRWILDPFLKDISFGRVDGKPLVPSEYYVTASALYVINAEQNDITDMKNNFVAYPYGEYPAELFDESWYLSFSVIADKKNKWLNNKVVFNNALIEIKGENKSGIIVSGRKFDYVGYGLNNILIWKASGLKQNKKYNVVIKNVFVNNENLTFSYFFMLKK